MFRSIVCPAVFLVLICCARLIQAQQAAPATTTCEFTFTAGKSNAYLKYCVTANGNITQIETPFGHSHMVFAEGYGICDESPATEYHDYASGASGNWNPATLVSLTNAAVKIARSTGDGNWTLTQTITKVPKTSSITIAMALRNNQAVDKVAYLIRYAQVIPNVSDGSPNTYLGATVNGAFAWSSNPPPLFGLQLQNVGTPPFGFWQAYIKVNGVEPNSCNFAANHAGGFAQWSYGQFVIAYVGLVPALQTKTVSLSYRGL